MTEASAAILAEFADALMLPGAPPVQIAPGARYPSVFATSDLAASSIAAAGWALSKYLGQGASVTVDQRRAALWFHMSLRPDGWCLPAPWDPLAGDYPCRDGWIRLHTNAPHHKVAALRALGCEDDPAALAAAVATWTKAALETAIVAENGCAAAMYDAAGWAAHPQGQVVEAEPLLHHSISPMAARPLPDPPLERPLSGIRVLDLTRVLAGPIATRFLAGFGAEVLRIDPPDWAEPALEAEVTPGKACARLDLRAAPDQARFLALLSQADVLIHGYRADALERLGLGQSARGLANPGLIDVALNAYGWCGPWKNRRGFDSLVQMSSGISAVGQARMGADRPVPLPVQALDHATGYLLAAAALRGLAQRRATGHGSQWRTSLARMAALLKAYAVEDTAGTLAPGGEAADFTQSEATVWGPARRIASPLEVGGIGFSFSRPAGPLGVDPAGWPPSP